MLSAWGFFYAKADLTTTVRFFTLYSSFIVKLYGNSYKNKFSIQLKKSNSFDTQSTLEACLSELKKELETKYIIDIFSDGTDELKKMLRPLWRTLKILLSFPVLYKSNTYFIGDAELTHTEFLHTILNRINNKYTIINDTINSPEFLSGITEDDLFSLYTKLCQSNKDEFSSSGGFNKIGTNEQKLNTLIGLNGIKESIKKIKAYALSNVNSYIQSEKINIPLTSDSPKTNALSGEEELDKLVGLSQVKRMIKKIKAYAKKNRDSADFNMHMCFFGNPGTGKTEVARILSKILYESGVLDEAKLVETDAHGLIGKFVGETAPKAKSKINETMNGVLFIDEAYALCGSANINEGNNYADEAVSVLIKEMENHRGQFCVILAGYKDETLELINSNPGFESRIQFKLDFPDYSKEELGEIAKKMLDKKHYDITPDALNIILDITDVLRTKPNFANARTLRNILDQVIMNQNLITEDSDSNDMLIIEQDVYDYIDDEGINMNATENKPKHSIGFI